MLRPIIITTASLLFVSACETSEASTTEASTTEASTTERSTAATAQAAVETDTSGGALGLDSPVFEDGERIPTEHTCEGRDVSPPLKWGAPPEGTASFALIVVDPDAPKGSWDHWLLYNMSARTRFLAEGAGDTPPDGAEAGKNSWKRTDYGGPCPPSGKHRYVFELFALDRELDLDTPTKSGLERAMKGHILARDRLVGTYEKRDE